MHATAKDLPDWRDARSYAVLLGADRPLFAWEWLRRDPSYREAATEGLERGRPAARARSPAAFGLVRFEAPGSAVPVARPFWRSDADPSVLAAARVQSGAPADLFDADRLARFATVVSAGGSEHLLLCDGLRTLRLDGAAGAFTTGPACLRYAIAGIANAQRPLETLRRFLALCRMGRFASSLHRREARARRWILMLRAWDALVAGADQREIAAELFSRSASDRNWRTREPSVRSQVQRLVRSTRALARGGYRRLLQ